MSGPRETAAAWSAVTASVRGASHDRTGLPNQDAVRVADVEGRTLGVVAAVADGHGGSRYVRSATGSSVAVDIACDVAREVLQELGGNPDTKNIRDALAGRIAPAVVQQWRDRVRGDHDLHPFTDEESARGGANLAADPYIAYGCTLIVALMGPTWVGLLQIGDGDALVVEPDGSVASPIPTDDRLVGGETTSLCLPGAVNDARIAVRRAPLPELVVLASDGYGNSFESPRWREESGAGFLEAVRRDGLDHVATKLPGWLNDSAQAGGDDVTMVLARRTGGATAAAAGRPAGAAKAAKAAKPKRAAAVGGLAAALIIGVIGGGTGGWFARGNGTAAVSTTSTSTTSTTSTTSSTTTTTSIATGTRREMSVIGDGRIVTFVPDATNGVPNPHVTGLDSALKGATQTPLPPATATARIDGTAVVVFTGKRIEMGRSLGAIVQVGEWLWVLSKDGSGLRPLKLAETAPKIAWQHVAELPAG